jgi:hypothetical protein
MPLVLVEWPPVVVLDPPDPDVDPVLCGPKLLEPPVLLPLVVVLVVVETARPPVLLPVLL